MKTAIPLPLAQLVDFCQRWKIVRLEVFGSVLRSDFTEHSDVDFLASFARDAKPSLFSLVEAEDELSSIVGRRAEIAIREGVEESQNWIRREAILSSAELIYAA